MTVLNDPDFWKWLKEKESKENENKGFEPIPLYISVDIPKAPEKTDSNQTDVDYTVDNVIFEF